MAEQNLRTTILVYASVAFILLGVLFGMNIMTFIFGTLGPDVSGISKTGNSVINSSDGFLNFTGYPLPGHSDSGASNFIMVEVWNFTTNPHTQILLATTNYTVSYNGVLKTPDIAFANFTDGVNATYTFESDQGARLVMVNIQNDSLNSIQTYADNSSTQFSTISIAIILVILISLFALFWVYFMAGSKGTSKSEGTYS